MIMKQLRLVATTLLLVQTTLGNAPQQWALQGLTFFSPRSQGTNLAQQIVGWHPYIHMFTEGRCYFTFATSLAYNHSRRPERINAALWSNDVLAITGSHLTTRGDYDLIADHFGLSPYFQSRVKLEPSIRNGMLNFDFYCGLDGITKGLYVQGHIPAVWTRWFYQLCEELEPTSENTDFEAGYMGDGEVPVGATCFKEAIAGCTKSFGDMQDPMRYGKISPCPLTKRGVADLHLFVGYDFVSRETSHAGLNLRIVIPTGNRPNGEYLFEPIIGNGRHVELGVGFTGHTLVWESSGDQELTFWTTLTLHHLFRARQCRSFDLNRGICKPDCSGYNCRPDPCTPGAVDGVMCEEGFCCQSAARCCTTTNYGSRYMLMKKFDAHGEYANELTPVINHTTLPCKVSVDIRTELLLMLGYTYRNFLFDVGYDGWMRSKEKIKIKACPFKDENYALKGIQQVRDTALPERTANDTQSHATLAGYCDNHELAIRTNDDGTTRTFAEKQVALRDEDSPVFITPEMVETRSAASPRLLTHKLFTHLGYIGTEEDNRPIAPFCGVGLEVEFEGVNPTYVEVPVKNTLSQWSIWTRGGIHF